MMLLPNLSALSCCYCSSRLCYLVICCFDRSDHSDFSYLRVFPSLGLLATLCEFSLRDHFPAWRSTSLFARSHYTPSFPVRWSLCLGFGFALCGRRCAVANLLCHRSSRFSPSLHLPWRPLPYPLPCYDLTPPMRSDGERLLTVAPSLSPLRSLLLCLSLSLSPPVLPSLSHADVPRTLATTVLLRVQRLLLHTVH